MPDEGKTDQQGHRQKTARPDVPAQPGAPQGPVPQAPMQQPPTQEQQPAQQPPAQQRQPTGQMGRPILVHAAATRVTGRRIVQYIIDYILAGIIPGLAYWQLDTNAGSIDGLRWFVATVIALAAYFAYWVAIPYAMSGQTFAMKLLRLRVLSKDGDRASITQLFVRGIFLIVDTLIFGLVGYITILCSRYRQRVGDHAAKTVVVSANYGRRI
jgi:uncharacterized RDD family membrane protein YckC